MCGVPKASAPISNEIASVGATSTADSTVATTNSTTQRSRIAALEAQNIMTPTTGLGIANTQKKTLLGV